MERTMSGFGISENSTDPSLCINNCGFYGNPKHRNLCSKCYGDFLKENLFSISMKTVEDYQQRESENDFVALESNEEMNLSSELESKCRMASAIVKNRCVNCNKKVGLLGFKCRCGGLFCGKHRYPEEHKCDVDLKEIGRQTLAKQIVECKGDRLQYRI